MLLYIILLLYENVITSLMKYVVYDTNNNYPRPVLLNTNEVLALSGQNGGTYTKYSKNVEIVTEQISLFNYHNNSDIKQLIRDGRLVSVSGIDTDFEIILFSEVEENGKKSIQQKTTPTNHHTYSFKINLVPLSTGNILIGWTYTSLVYLAQYTLKDDDTFEEIKYTSWTTSNRYISCVELLKDNQKFVCQYVEGNCIEAYKILNEDFTIKTYSPLTSSLGGCSFDKVIKLSEEKVVMCYLPKNTMTCVLQSIEGFSVTTQYTKDIMGSCIDDTIKTDVSTFDENKFIGTCINNISSKVQVAIVTITDNILTSKVIQCSGGKADFPLATKFGDNFLTVFYHLTETSQNVFEIMEYPNCEDSSISLFINSNIKLDIANQVVKGSGDDSQTPLSVKYISIPTTGKLKTEDGKEIVENSIYSSTQSIVYYSDEEVGDFQLKFAGVNYESKTGKWCTYNINIKPCYVSCYTCNVDGDQINNSCLSCKKEYYPLSDKTTNCAKAPVEGYYFDIDIWKPCFTKCKTCLKEGNENNHNCDTCSNDLVKEYHTKNCVDVCPTGQYYDNTNKQCELCDSSCSSCSGSAKECLACNTNYEPICNDDTTKKTKTCINSFEKYYKDKDGNCYKSCLDKCATCHENSTCDTCSESYPLYFESKKICYKECPTSSYSVEKKCIPCHSNCKTCSIQGTNTSNNCDQCKEGLNPILQDKGKYNCVSPCSEDKYSNNGNCVDECPSNLGIEEESKLCINCKSNSTYLELIKQKCLDDFPEGYYIFTKSTDNVLYKCYVDCSVSYTDLDISIKSNYICNNEKEITPKCNSIIKIDDRLSIHFSPLNYDDKLKYIFSKGTADIQNKLIEEKKSSMLQTFTTNNTNSLLNLVSMNSLLSLSSDETISQYYSNTVNVITSILSCESLDSLLATDQTYMLLLSSLSLYSFISTNTKTIIEKDFVSLAKIAQCLTEKGTTILQITESSINKHSWIQVDFANIMGLISDDLLSILSLYKAIDPDFDEIQFKNDEQYRFAYSLVLSDSRTSLKNLIESISTMIALFEEGKAYSFTNILFTSKTLNNLNNEYYLNSDILVSTKKCDDLNKQITQIGMYEINGKMCVPYDSIISENPLAYSFSLVQYNSFPLLSPNVTNYIDKKFNSIAIRQQSGEEIKGLSSIFTLIQKQSKEDFSSCIRYNSDISNFTNAGCTSQEYGEGFLVCNCTTLKDISMTSYTQEVLNTSTVVVKAQSRFINSFSSFQYIDGESSIVLYFIICLLIIYLILLFFALLHDIRSKDNNFIVMVSNSDCCKSKREKEKDLHQMKNLIFLPKKSAYKEDIEKVTDNHEQFIEMNDMTDATDNSSPAVLQKKDKKKNITPLSLSSHNNSTTSSNNNLLPRNSSTCSLYGCLFKSLFIKEYYIIAYFNSDKSITKVNVLNVFVVRIIVALALCGIFTDCVPESSLPSNVPFLNGKDFSVGILSIIILDIPMTVLECMLYKTRLTHSQKDSAGQVKINTIFRHIIVYVIFFVLFLFGGVNITWFSIDSRHNHFATRFLRDFVIAMCFDLLIYHTVIILVKALILTALVRIGKDSIIRTCLLSFVIALPWVFNL